MTQLGVGDYPALDDEPVVGLVDRRRAVHGAVAVFSQEPLPRSRALGLLLPVNDFWLFDGKTAIINDIAGDGNWADGEVFCTDTEIIAGFLASFEPAWRRAIPHTEYSPRVSR